jgi:hypothetical protein
MRRSTVFAAIAAAALLAAGCGEDEATSAQPATSDPECFTLWNAEPGDEMAGFAGEMVLVEFKNGECVVATPSKDSPDWLVWIAAEGRGPYGEPNRQAYGSFAFNARAREDGKLDSIN